MSRFGTALKHAWNVFQSQYKDNYAYVSDYTNFGAAYSQRPDRPRLRIPTGQTIVSAIYTRLGIDVATIDIRHVRVDSDNQYVDDIDSGLNNCLTVQANIDQAPTQFRQDIAMTLFDSGSAVLVPVDTSINPGDTSGGFDILTLRVGEVVTWYPEHVRVNLYNEQVGYRQQVTVPKSNVAVIENPLYSVMNEPNSTLQRLLLKLGQLDAIDEQSSSGNLDLIIQLPYVIKSEARRQQAEQRRTDIEFQLRGSKYGIAYTDSTERVTQLNRPATNNLMDQITYLTNLLYSQLGLTEEVMNGTANEQTMLNYWNRTIEPILTAITEGMKRSFLTKTALTQNQSIMFLRDPFKIVPLEQIATLADKLIRNEVLTANEMRGKIGFKPSSDPKANELSNPNIRGVPGQQQQQPVDPNAQPAANGATPPPSLPPPTVTTNGGSATVTPAPGTPNPATQAMSDSFDQIDKALDDALKSV